MSDDDPGWRWTKIGIKAEFVKESKNRKTEPWVGFPMTVGSLSVGLLLLRFFLKLVGFLTRETRSYLRSNLLGALLACHASILSGFLPFILLEGTWAVVALIARCRLWRYAERLR